MSYTDTTKTTNTYDGNMGTDGLHNHEGSYGATSCTAPNEKDYISITPDANSPFFMINDSGDSVTSTRTSFPGAEKVDMIASSLNVFIDEFINLVELAIPSTVVRLGFMVPQSIVAALIGKYYGIEHLDGFTFGNLVANVFTLSILLGILSATDSLAPQPFGAKNHRQVGILAIRGAAVCMGLILPPNILAACFLDKFLLYLGQPPLAAMYAGQYYRVFVFGLPFNILYFVGWKFLAAQGKMRPLMVATLLSFFVTLPLSLHFFMGWYGFIGLPLALAVFWFSQAGLLIGYLWYFRPHHAATWEGLSVWREALDWTSVKDYVKLGLGGVFSLSDWLFFELLTLVVGIFGIVPLSVHSISTQAFSTVMMLPSGMGLALAVRVGTLMTIDYEKARKLMQVCYGIFSVVFVLLSVLMFHYRFFIIGLFTTNPAVIEVSRK